MILRLAVKLPEEETYVRTARLLSRTLLEDMKVIPADVDAVGAIIGELCSNVVRHAHSHAALFDVVMDYYEPRVVVTVSDRGEGFTLEDVPPPGRSRPDRDGGERVGGFGLSLVAGLADRIDFAVTTPHGTTVCVEKALCYQTEADADAALKRDGAGGDVSADVG